MPSNSDTVPCGLPSCERNVTTKTGGVSCARCLRWFHINCVKVSAEELNFLLKSKGKFVYECEKCTSSGSAVAELREEVRNSREEVRCSNISIQEKLDALLSKIGNYDMQINSLNEEVINCNKLIKHVDESNSSKVKQLEDKNEILQKRFNRSDIVINGLDREHIDLEEVVFKIFKFLKIKVCHQDINICCYINNRKCVLIKFNSLVKRDEVMRSYFNNGKLFEADFLNNDKVTKRIYLNDHLTEKGGKLGRLCRDLRRDDIIAKFRILNSDLPRVKIHFKDSVEKIFEYEECFSYFENIERPKTSKKKKNRPQTVVPNMIPANKEPVDDINEAPGENAAEIVNSSSEDSDC